MQIRTAVCAFRLFADERSRNGYANSSEGRKNVRETWRTIFPRSGRLRAGLAAHGPDDEFLQGDPEALVAGAGKGEDQVAFW